MKPFTVAEMTVKGQSRSPAMSSFIRSPGHSIGDRKSRLRLFSDKIAEMTLKVIKVSLTNGTTEEVTCHFLLVVCSNHVSILYRF